MCVRIAQLRRSCAVHSLFSSPPLPSSSLISLLGFGFRAPLFSSCLPNRQTVCYYYRLCLPFLFFFSVPSFFLSVFFCVCLCARAHLRQQAKSRRGCKRCGLSSSQQKERIKKKKKTNKTRSAAANLWLQTGREERESKQPAVVVRAGQSLLPPLLSPQPRHAYSRRERERERIPYTHLRSRMDYYPYSNTHGEKRKEGEHNSLICFC